MGAVTETTSTLTEFSGNYKVAVVEVDGPTSSGTLTIDEFTVIKGAIAGWKEAPTADCMAVEVEVDGTTTNQLNISLYESDWTANTQNPIDFYVFAIGY